MMGWQPEAVVAFRHLFINCNPYRMQLKGLKCKPSPHCTCQVPLIDGLGYQYVFMRGLAQAHGESKDRLATLVDSMRVSIHALHCDLLCLEGIYTEPADLIELSPV